MSIEKQSIQESLRIPGEEELLATKTTDLHEIWRENHHKLELIASKISLSKFPKIGMYGTYADGVKYIQNGKKDDIDLAAVTDKPTDATRLLADLYGMANVTTGYSFIEPGESAILIFIFDDEKQYDAGGGLPHGMLGLRKYPLPAGQPADPYGTYDFIPMDTADEAELFSLEKSNLKHHRLLGWKHSLAPLAGVIKEADVSRHLLKMDKRVHPVEESYRTAICRRIFIQPIVLELLDLILSRQIEDGEIKAIGEIMLQRAQEVLKKPV